MPARSGGGIQGKNVVQTSNPKVEPTVNNISPNRPSMIGLKHYQESAKGPLYQSSKSTTPFGTTPSVAGPGGGRMIMPSGSQSKTPAPRPMGSGRSLFK
jgi:hypothetical protein